jgi:hypothetical protein
MTHTHDDKCLDRPSLRPGRRIPFIIRDLTWNYFRTAGRAWGPMVDRGYRWRLYLSFGHLTVWVGAW